MTIYIYLFCTYYPSSSKNLATTFGAILSLKSSFMVFGNESNARTSAGQCSCPNLIQSTLPGLNRLSEDVFAIFNDIHVKKKILWYAVAPVPIVSLSSPVG